MYAQRKSTMPMLILTFITVLNVVIMLNLLTPFLPISLAMGAIIVIAAVEAVVIYLTYTGEKRNTKTRTF